MQLTLTYHFTCSIYSQLWYSIANNECESKLKILAACCLPYERIKIDYGALDYPTIYEYRWFSKTKLNGAKDIDKINQRM